MDNLSGNHGFCCRSSWCLTKDEGIFLLLSLEKKKQLGLLASARTKRSLNPIEFEPRLLFSSRNDFPATDIGKIAVVAANRIKNFKIGID